MTRAGAVPPISPPGRRHDRLSSVAPALILCALCGRAFGSDKLQDGREIMGTLVTVIVFADNETSGEAALEAAFGEITSVDDLMSTWRDDTELARINASAGAGPVQVSDELFEVLERATDISALTAGAFDVTVGPLVELWKAAAKRDALPTELELARARRFVGYRKILLDKKKRTVTLPEGMSIDLGAIAKGYAVDKAAGTLRALGIEAFLIEAGGDLFAAGHYPDTPPRPWSVGIKDPFDGDSGKLIRGLVMTDRGAATSGHYYRSVTIKGAQYSHIVDPRTGRPVEGVADSVTVIAPNCMDADAFATALSVLGVQRAEDVMALMNADLADNPFAAFIISHDQDRPTFTYTTAFPQYDIPPKAATSQPSAIPHASRRGSLVVIVAFAVVCVAAILLRPRRA